MRFFKYFFFMSQHLIGPRWMPGNSLIFFREFSEIFVHKVWLSVDYLQKVRTFRKLYCGGIILGKSKPFRGKIRGKACKPRIILPQGRLLHSTIHGKFWLFTHYSAEKHAFLLDNQWKVKTLCKAYCRKACPSAG
jgi:hypothetical protein